MVPDAAQRMLLGGCNTLIGKCKYPRTLPNREKSKARSVAAFMPAFFVSIAGSLLKTSLR